jgi:hypothetical protein
VNRQLDAYNRRDIDAFCRLFHPDAVTGDLESGEMSIRGIDAIRAFYGARFADNPAIHCVVHGRMEIGEYAIDRETVTGVAGGPLEILAIYEVRDGLIRSIRFIRRSAGPA